MEFHEIASIFPMMTEPELQVLADDIKANGLREPIVVHEGKIIDGRNRYRACELVGVEPHYEEWNGNGSLVAYVVSLNLHRRHLSESQRSMVATRLATLKDGQKQGASIEAPTQREAAKMLKVGRVTVQRARVVEQHGVPELVQAVERDEISVFTAEQIARLPQDQQEEIMSQSKAEIVQSFLPHPPKPELHQREAPGCPTIDDLGSTHI